ncbi:tetratricopeptide repeat-containing diguanylate cyclase [Thalassotalea sp. G2M2-11]|uniref:tetratricopeptide repeat-containing diguanylate cyclase n=1 Tax=Thalassotalea sp. G2M2-11 TaxID=2787627 RepID=UPI0019D212E2|nr:tetratricopeptide repeat-containing diguanylate cyclase [Thalassotalea sp. G2M2-11]
MQGSNQLQRMKVIYIFLILFITNTVLTTAFAASSSIEKISLSDIALLSVDKQIFKNPWLAYQQILSFQTDNKSLTKTQQQWLQIRKAQCENLLYFYPKFEQSINQLSEMVTAGSPARVLAHLNYFKGLLMRRSGDYKGSRSYFTQAMEGSKEQEDYYVYVKSKLELAYTHSLAELFDTSLSDMQAIYIEAFALKDNFLIGMIDETYAAIYGYMRQYKKSIEYYEKALEIYQQLGYKAHIAEAVYGIASTYRYWKKHDLAVKNFKLYQEILSYTPNNEISYFASYGLGMTLAEQGKCQLALVEIERAFSLHGVDDFDAELYKRKASCLIKLKQYQAAEQALEQATKIFDQIPELHNTAWQIEVNKVASELAYARQEYQKAYQLSAKYYQRYTEILIESSTERVATIRASMEIERQDIETALAKQRLKAEKLALQTKEQQALQQRYFIIFLLVLLGIFFAVMVYQHRTNRKIFELSIVDSLSGLYNRRYTFKYLDKQIQGTSVEQGELCIVVFDIDDFKQVNDNYGHPVGDMVIEQVAKVAQETLRTEDTIGRIGGEEFLCILPRTDVAKGETIAQRLRQRLSSYQFEAESGAQIHVSASFGLAKYSSAHQDAKAFYAAADKALYVAKEQGKNCVVIADESL